MGPAPAGGRPFDGASYRRPFPEALRLTDEQRAEIAALRAAFRAEHADELDALKAIFEEARAARANGATREEIRAILVTARPIAMALRIDLIDLHYAIWSVFTDEQKAWILSHRPHRLPPPMVPGDMAVDAQTQQGQSRTAERIEQGLITAAFRLRVGRRAV
jgi:hypothetical protein